MKKLNYLLASFSFLFVVSALAKNEALLNEIIAQASVSESDSVVIIQNNQTLYSHFTAGQDQLHNVQSITKSVAGLAIGILLDEGKITSLDLLMSKWYPEWAQDEIKSKITLRMMMSHTSGLSDTLAPDDFFKSPDLITAGRGLPTNAEPGSRFEYCNVAIVLLQPVIEQSAGIKLEKFIALKIFSPLGITEFKFRNDSFGHESLAGGLSLNTDGLIRLGQLVLGQGEFKGKKIISKQALNTLLTKHQDFKSYGLLWWLGRRDGALESEPYELFKAIGWGGQYIVIYPTMNLIAVRTKDPYTIDDAKYEVQNFPEFPKLIAKWQ